MNGFRCVYAKGASSPYPTCKAKPNPNRHKLTRHPNPKTKTHKNTITAKTHPKTPNKHTPHPSKTKTHPKTKREDLVTEVNARSERI